MPDPFSLDTRLAGEPHWSPVHHPALLKGRPSFLKNQPPGGLQYRYYTGPERGVLWARAWFGPLTEGPPGHAHGGSMAAMLDELVGGAAWLAGHPVVAATLNVRFRHMLPVDTVVTGHGAVSSASGRRVRVVGSLSGPDGIVYAEADGIFAELRGASLDRLPPEIRQLLARLKSDLEARQP
jgi:acyl-coenzyme A thioesterase PaaI-like protein